MNRVEWPLQKASLLFLGLCAKGIAFAPEPLPFYWGDQARAVCGILWLAFDGSFVYLLKPPSQKDSAAQ